MKIKHLKHKEIDFKKYDNCIKNAINHRVYAFSWYLDIVCKNWEVLILNDYQIVMPLPFRRIKKKFLKKMIEQPPFCQQLGVFSLTELSLDTFNLFLDKLETFTVNTYNFNSGNTSFLKAKNNYNKRDNFELNLNIAYNDIYKNYSKGLKYNIKKGTKNQLIIKKSLESFYFEKMNNEAGFHKMSTKKIKKFKTLTQKIIFEKKGHFYSVFKDEKLISVNFLIENGKKIIYLFSGTNETGKKYGATSFLLNNSIVINCNKNIVFDFEGSIIPGIAKFFKSFGSKNNPYPVFIKK